MPIDEERPPGFDLLGALRRMGGTALSTVHNRIELFALELQEEKCWLISTLLWSAVAVFFGGLAIVLSIGAIVLLSPEGARGWILGGFAVVFIVVAINAIVGLQRSMKQKPPPLAETLGELKKDLDWIQSQD